MRTCPPCTFITGITCGTYWRTDPPTLHDHILCKNWHMCGVCLEDCECKDMHVPTHPEVATAIYGMLKKSRGDWNERLHPSGGRLYYTQKPYASPNLTCKVKCSRNLGWKAKRKLNGNSQILPIKNSLSKCVARPDSYETPALNSIPENIITLNPTYHPAEGDNPTHDPAPPVPTFHPDYSSSTSPEPVIPTLDLACLLPPALAPQQLIYALPTNIEFGQGI